MSRKNLVDFSGSKLPLFSWRALGEKIYLEMTFIIGLT